MQAIRAETLRPITVDLKTACKLFTQWTPRNVRERVHKGTFPAPFVEPGGRKWCWYLADLEKFVTQERLQIVTGVTVKDIIR
jgi:hypothetical protein